MRNAEGKFFLFELAKVRINGRSNYRTFTVLIFSLKQFYCSVLFCYFSYRGCSSSYLLTNSENKKYENRKGSGFVEHGNTYIPFFFFNYYYYYYYYYFIIINLFNVGCYL